MAQILERWPSVVGGTIEPDHKFPWVVNVQGSLTGKGVLIAPTWVLTAAHLVETSFGGRPGVLQQDRPGGQSDQGRPSHVARVGRPPPQL